MSAARHALAFVLMLSVLGAAGWLGLVKPRFDAVEEAERKEARLKDEYKTLKNLAINLDLYKQQLRTLDERFGTLLGLLPYESQLRSPEGQQEIERRIGSVAQSLGMSSPEIVVGDTTYEENLATSLYSIVAIGDYRQLVRFLQGISTGSGRFWTVRGLILTTPSDTGRLTLAVGLRAHGFVHPEALAASKKERK